MPKVSVILPFFNAESTLYAAIESIVKQSYTNLEIILVDNGSIDESAHIARTWQQRDNRIKLIREERRGVAHAMNKGLSKASGDYIARMDSDDISFIQRIAIQARYLDENPNISFLFTQVDLPNSTSGNEGMKTYIKWSNQLCSWDQIRKNAFVEYPGVNPTLMMRSSIFNGIGYYRQGDFPEDYEYFLRAVQCGYKAAKIPKVLLSWQDSEGRLTRADLRYSRDAFQAVKTKYLVGMLRSKQIPSSKVWVWGAGKLAMKWTKMLQNEGLEVQGFIDVDTKKVSMSPRVVHFQEVNPKDQGFIISLVSNRGKREDIRTFLLSRGYIEEKDFIIAA